MRILKVRDLESRSITSFDVFIQMLFNGKAPSKFDPNTYYSAGDLVYIVNNDGSITIMQANANGIFSKPTEPNWSEFTLTKVLEKQTEMIKELTGIRSKISDKMYNVHTLVYYIEAATTSIDELNISEWLNDYHYCEVYVNDKYISTQFWEIDNNSLTFTPEFVASEVTQDNTKVVIRVNEAISLLTRMVRRLEERLVITPTENSDTLPTIKVPYPISPDKVDIKYDLYINGKFIPTQEYLEEDVDGEPIITSWSTDSANEYEFVFAFVYSISNEVQLIKRDYQTTIADIFEAYQLDLTSIDFINSFQEIKVFKEGSLVDADRYVISRGFVNMVDVTYYFSVGDRICCPVWTYILTQYDPGEVRHNSQSSPIFLDDTMRSPIPFLEWNPVTDDLMIFNDGGVFISDAKWYIDEYDVQYFSHDAGLSDGDILDFRLLNSDNSVKMQNFYVTVTADNNRVFTLPFNTNDYKFIMIFTTSGQYFTDNRYTISNNTITFTNDVSLLTDDRLEFVVFKYISDSTSTVMSREIVQATTTNQFVFKNPIGDYVASTDSLLIFNSKGEYIGERFYSIVDNGIILKGSPISLGEYLEVVLFRNLPITVSSGEV